MNLTFPVYVRSFKGASGRKAFFRASLLFFNVFSSENEDLQRALVRLKRQVKKWGDQSGSNLRHDTLEQLVYNPSLKGDKYKLTLKIKGSYVTGKFFFVIVESFDRQFAFCPDLNGVWFEIASGDQLELRATEVLETFFSKEMDKDERESALEEVLADGQCWITTIDVDLRTDQSSPNDNFKKMLSMWSNDEVNGAVELSKVGRCLDHLYPDDLEIAIGREELVDQVVELLKSEDRRPVLLIGDHLVGKTSLIHEAVRKRMTGISEQKSKKAGKKKNVWLLGPQRLISGMSYVGQWEDRVLAILKEAEKQDHVLYFDDLPGLFRAGQSRDSNLCVADLLKTALQDRTVRVLGEITPAAYDVLSELDRSFAEQFHVVRLDPTSTQETYAVAINVVRKFEFENDCIFGLEAIATATELQRQYVPQTAFPGKVVRFLRQLSIKYSGLITSHMVVTEFCNSTGVSADLVDAERSVDRKRVYESFAEGLVGQEAAVEACADMILAAKAKLNAPGKPLATMLFLGPTGVGKTECAKLLSRFLFPGRDKLLRYDLNEFKTAYSAARLIGTADQPEGLLTSAVRRQPFCVILLDEIEKAHPDVYDILLQVTGEGRLTDSIGRTTDFTQSIIVMTSNLGTKRAGQTVGFVNSPGEQEFYSAAEKFFRPEFFNRIDRVIPFHNLNEAQIGKIADRLMDEVVSREGIVRRRCILQIDPNLISRVIAKGYHPELGARAMKRAIETEFTQPVAARLATIRSDVPTVIRIRDVAHEQEDGQEASQKNDFEVDVYELKNVEQVLQPTETPDFDELVDAANHCLDRLRIEYFSVRPPGEISSSGLSQELVRYFVLVEQAEEIAEHIRKLAQITEDKREEPRRPAIAVSGNRSRRSERGEYNSKQVLKEINAVDDIRSYVSQAVTSVGESPTLVDPRALQVMRQCSLLESLCTSEFSEAIFFVQASSTQADLEADTFLMASFYHQGQFEDLGFEIVGVTEGVEERLTSTTLFHLRGDGLGAYLSREVGANLFCDRTGKLRLFHSGFVTVDDPAFAELAALVVSKENKETNLTKTLATHSDLRTLRMFDYKRNIIDFRTGIVQRLTIASRISEFIVAGIPLPKEFEQFCHATDAVTTVADASIERGDDVR